MQQSSKRLFSMILALVFLVAAFVCFFDLVEPAYSAVEALRGQQLGVAASLASEKTLVSQAQTLVTAYDNQSQSQTNASLALPTGQDIAGALTQIEGMAQIDNLLVTAVAVSSPTVQTQNSAAAVQSGATPTAPVVKPLGSFTVKLTAQGSYEDFQNFISHLETNIRLFDIRAISFQQASTGGVVSGKIAGASNDSFVYNVTVQTYYQLP